jgi:hypothetical protein
MLPRVTATALALGFLLSVSAAAYDRTGAIGSAGEIYLTRVGSYGVLFPKGNAYPASNVVLTLEISRPRQAPDRVLVPGTEGADVESASLAIYEEESKTLFLVWQSNFSGINRLILRSFKDGSFGPPIEVAAGTFQASMSAPQAVVTRNEFSVAMEDGGTATFHRTLIHLIWWQGAEAGNQVLYAPITLLEGEYTGWHPVYSLYDFDSSPDDPAAAAEILPQLYRAPRIQTGRNDHTVEISFANERNGRLAVLDVSLLPGEISALADKIRAHVIEIGRRSPSAQTIADKIRAHVIEIGRLSPNVVSFLSNDVYQHILSRGGPYVAAGNYTGLADDVSAYVTVSAANLLENGRLGDDSSGPQILRLANSDEGDDVGAPRLQVRRVFSRPAPRTAAAPTTIFASKDGKALLVAWDTASQIRYRESSPEGWSEVLAIQITPELTREQAYNFLEQRLRR